MFGAYPDDLNLQTDFRRAFLDGLRASEVHRETTHPIPAGLAPRITTARLYWPASLDAGGVPKVGPGEFSSATGGMWRTSRASGTCAPPAATSSSVAWRRAQFFRENEPAVREAVRALSPQKRNGAGHKSQMLAVSIDSRDDYAFPGYTLNPPFRQALTETYGRGIRVDPWGVRSEPDGIGVFIDSGERTVRLRPMKHAEVISALFGEVGLQIEPSVGGRLHHLSVGKECASPRVT